MRRAVTYLIVAMALCAPVQAAERRSWNKVRYVGGTLPVPPSRYDFNAKVTISTEPDTVVIEIAPTKLFAPGQTVRLKPSQIVSLSSGTAAWRHIADLPGAKVPAKSPSLFGVLKDNGYVGIVYEDDHGNRQGILLDTLFGWQFLPALGKLSGKDIEVAR
jgi:hypothetical protein